MSGLTRGRKKLGEREENRERGIENGGETK